MVRAFLYSETITYTLKFKLFHCIQDNIKKDPSAGSGILLMNIASRIETDKASVYSQDISQKSSNLLRMNSILNGIIHSISQIVQENTIIGNRHPEKWITLFPTHYLKLDFSDW